ncbi:MAG: Ig-like domain-containing protein [Mogibacterium sp.]|nr:Ig-like domain-containing protein [Mogibacterium sp.]
MKMRKLFGLCILMSCLVLSTGMVFADNVNTDDDKADRDGSYTFTTDGERYGYESYLLVDKVGTNDPVYVGARLYDVTIPEDGQLVAEVDSDQIKHMTIEICSEREEEKAFSSDSGVKGRFESEALPAGTYTVIFEYTLQPSSIIPYDDDMGGKRYFKHYITWVKTPSVKAQSLTLSETAVTIERGGSLLLTASIDPANAYHRKVTWMSSSPSVAEVSESGCVYGVSEGIAVITATNSDGITKSSCTVTVTEMQEEKEAEERTMAEAESQAGEEIKPEEATLVDAVPDTSTEIESKIAKAKKLVVKNVKARAIKGKKAIIRWSKKSSASGYQVQYSTKKSFKKKATKSLKVKGASKKTINIKKLKAGKTYYVRVRTYKNVKNSYGETVKVYGKWSKVVRLRAKK